MKEILLTKGKIALVDDEDYEWLNQWKWYYNNGYATRNIHKKNTFKRIWMHRLILGISDSNVLTDHINQDRLDNRRCNLRSCDYSQNMANCGMGRLNTSGRRGVSWNKDNKKWFTAIRFHGKHIFLGEFNELEIASQTYNRKFKELFGEFAYIENKNE